MKHDISFTKMLIRSVTSVVIVFFTTTAFALNPLIMDQFTVDPTARVINGKLHVFVSDDIIPPENKRHAQWFNMVDYHVFSSENLTQWTDHGKILDQKGVPWADPDAYSIWARDGIAKNCKYSFYFSFKNKGATVGERGFFAGLAIADNPNGSYKPQLDCIKGVEGIDLNVFIDRDGQAYLYWSRGKVYGVKLKDNMLELDSEIKTFNEISQKGHSEGPFVFERKVFII